MPQNSGPKRLMRSQSKKIHSSVEEVPSDEERQVELAIALSLQEAENQERQNTPESSGIEHIIDISPRKQNDQVFYRETSYESVNCDGDILEFDLTELDDIQPQVKDMSDNNDMVSTPVRRACSASSLNTQTLRRFTSKLNLSTPTVHTSTLCTPHENRSPIQSTPSEAQPYELHNSDLKSTTSSSRTVSIFASPPLSPNLDADLHSSPKYSPGSKSSRIIADGDERSFNLQNNSPSPLFSRSSSRMVICSSPEEDSLNDFDVLPVKSTTHSPYKTNQYTSSPKFTTHTPSSRRDGKNLHFASSFAVSSPIRSGNPVDFPSLNPKFSPSSSPQSVKRQLYFDESETQSLTPTKRRPEFTRNLSSSDLLPKSPMYSPTKTRNRSEISRQTTTEEDDLVACPMCHNKFLKNIIEVHASDCNGPVASPTAECPATSTITNGQAENCERERQKSADLASAEKISNSLTKPRRSLGNHRKSAADVFLINTNSQGDDITGFSDEESRVFAPISTKRIQAAFPLSPTTFGLDDPFGSHVSSSQPKGKAKVIVKNPVSPPRMRSRSIKSKGVSENHNKVMGGVPNKLQPSRPGLIANTEPINISETSTSHLAPLLQHQPLDYSFDEYENGYVWEGESSDHVNSSGGGFGINRNTPAQETSVNIDSEDDGYSSPLEGFTNLHEHKNDPELMKYMSQFEPSARRRAARMAKEAQADGQLPSRTSATDRRTSFQGRKNKWSGRKRWKSSKKKGVGASKTPNRRPNAGTAPSSLATTHSGRIPQHNHYNDEPGFGSEGFRWETRGVAAYAGWRL
ncbi:hypothetical protein K7432_009920 [Basidiobolus ranarum]|uniref:UBZ4-type domain-containing protein n=1 Tax=Basidiobolus ranarum TaxID=34480 RepID=A0ABR2VWC0_9FUNG